MADPVTWLLIGGTALQGAGTIAETMGARAEADTEARVAERNAEASALQSGQAQDTQRRRNREILARQAAVIGESNIGFTGSTQKLREQTAAELELDALNIAYGGELDRQSFKTQARMARKRKSIIGTTGFLRTSGQLLGGGAQAYAYNRSLPRGP